MTTDHHPRTPENTVNRFRRGRTAALVAALVTGLAVVYTLALLLGLRDPGWAALLRAVFHLGELAALVGLALCGAAGRGLPARLGFGAAALGQVLLAVAEVVFGTDPALAEVLFGAGPVLVGLGLVAVGVAVVRTGAWSGRRRLVPLALGAYVFVVMTPALVVSGGPPAPVALWALAGWDALWFLIAVSVLAEPAGARGRSEDPGGARTSPRAAR